MVPTAFPMAVVIMLRARVSNGGIAVSGSLLCGVPTVRVGMPDCGIVLCCGAADNRTIGAQPLLVHRWLSAH